MTLLLTTHTDAALIAAARTDPDAFNELYRRYAERVHGYFARRTRDQSAALDLTAETFAQAWLVRARFRDEAEGSAAPWLFGIARNALLMSVRRGTIERRATERLGLMARLDRPPATAAPDDSWADGADEQLGDALHAAATTDVRRTAAPAPRPVRRRRRRLVVAAVAAAIAIPGAALAANALLSPSQVAQSIPQGTLALLDTHPTCTTVAAGVEYDCTLQTAPSAQGGIAPGQWLSTVEPTVDATKHVNGGCRSLNAAGTRWHCYVGQAAVREKIIGAGFLGQVSYGPGQG